MEQQAVVCGAGVHFEVPVWVSDGQILIQFPVRHLWKQQKPTQMPESLTCMWETRMEFWFLVSPGPDLAAVAFT